MHMCWHRKRLGSKMVVCSINWRKYGKKHLRWFGCTQKRPLEETPVKRVDHMNFGSVKKREGDQEGYWEILLRQIPWSTISL